MQKIAWDEVRLAQSLHMHFRGALFGCLVVLFWQPWRGEVAFHQVCPSLSAAKDGRCAAYANLSLNKESRRGNFRPSRGRLGLARLPTESMSGMGRMQERDEKCNEACPSETPTEPQPSTCKHDAHDRDALWSLQQTLWVMPGHTDLAIEAPQAAHKQCVTPRLPPW